MHFSLKKNIVFALFFLCIVSCSNKSKVPKGILPQPKMQAVLWDLISAGEFLNGYIVNKDSVDKLAESSKRYGQVLQFHEISKEEFDKSWSYYRTHPALMRVILDSLSKKQYIVNDTTTRPRDRMMDIDSMKRRIRKREIEVAQ